MRIATEVRRNAELPHHHRPALTIGGTRQRSCPTGCCTSPPAATNEAVTLRAADMRFLCALRIGGPLKGLVPDGAYQSGFVGDDDGLDAVAEAELAEDACNVGFDGRLGQVEVGRKFGVVEALGQQA